MSTFRTTQKAVAVFLAVVTIGSLTAATVLAAPPANPPAGSNFAQRLRIRKVEQQIRFAEEDDRERVVNRCVQAQNTFREIQQRIAPAFDNRREVYVRMDAKLWVVIGQLKLAEQDTFRLERQRTILAGHVATLQRTFSYYSQTVDDLVLINCQADPAGFQALLNTARLYHTRVRTQSEAVRDYVVDTIKPTLARHSQDIQNGDAREEN